MDIPEVRFDESMGIPIFPRPELKQAVLVPIPEAESGGELPTFIKPEWGGVQIFFGDYYAIIRDGIVIYGSAKDQWLNMHHQVGPDIWVKVVIPMAYQATEVCRIVTLIPESESVVREANFTLQPGDWIVRQPGGEVQHIKAAKFPALYFSDKEAEELGLTQMSLEQFKAWAIARASVPVTT